MRRILFSTLLAAILIGPITARAACEYGPDFCTDDPRIAPLLADKKTTLKKDYPDRLVSLLDIGSQCVARIERSPDVFTMWLVYSDDSKTTALWSQEDEERAKANIASGEMKHFWIFNSKEAFACGGDLKPSDRPDWNNEDEVSADAAILCDNSGCTK